MKQDKDTMIYLDYAATAPMRADVILCVADAFKITGNPSSVHRAGRAAKSIIEKSRASVASLVGARTRDVVFTGGGTEANNTVLKTADVKSLIISAIEHESVFQAAYASGKAVFSVPVDTSGVIDFSALQKLLEEAPKPALVSVMFANNETGVIEPVKKVVEIAKNFNVRVHCDAVQAAGKCALDLTELGVDYLTLSSHKIGGPQGVGAIILGPRVPLASYIQGGGQELGRRSGTENVAGIAGFGCAARLASLDVRGTAAIKEMRDEMERSLMTLNAGVRIVAHDTERLPGTSCLILPGVKGETQVMHMDLAGICVSSGSACSSGKVAESHVLKAMGYSPDEAKCSIRISIGYGTTLEEIRLFLKSYAQLIKRLESTGMS